MKTSIPSPARSLGAPRTPRRFRSRGTRSVGSPARSDVSVRLATVADNVRDSQGSFALSPMNRKSVLTDDTDIEEPRRKSWWKKLDDTTQDVMEVLRSDNVNNANKVVEEYVDVEIFSQERKSISLDIPDSSGSETIGSIVLPQRRLFTQKENKPVKTFGKVLGPRESLAKLQKTTTEADKVANVGPKQLFTQGPSLRSRPAFPANLLNITPNKTGPSEELVEANPKKLFALDKPTKKKTFTSALIESSPEKIDVHELETVGPSKLFNKEKQHKTKPIFPAELLGVSPNKTAPNKTKESAGEVRGQVRNLFGNKAGVKRKNMFADFIVSESEDEIQDVQPKVFGFPKGSKSRGSSVSRGREASPLSSTTDIELEDWKMLPSSTMMVDQLEYMVTGSPMKKMRLSKLSEQKESDGSKASTTANKTKLSNKSVGSKNKSKSVQNTSKSKIIENEIVVEKDDAEKHESKTLIENDGMENVDENKSEVQDDDKNNVGVENNATYNIKNRTHSIHKNSSKIAKSNADEEISQQKLETRPADHERQLDVAVKTTTNSFEKAETQINNDEDEELALTYEDDVEEPIIEEVQANQCQTDQMQDKIENVEPISNKEYDKNTSKTLLQTEPAFQTQDKDIDTSKQNLKVVDDYANDNFEEAIDDHNSMNVESVLKDEDSEVIQDNHDSKLKNVGIAIEESIEEIQKEIERGESENIEEKPMNEGVEPNQEVIVQNLENTMQSQQIVNVEKSGAVVEQNHKNLENNVITVEQDNAKAQQNDLTSGKNLEKVVERDQEEIEQGDAELEQSQEAVKQNKENVQQNEEVNEQNQEPDLERNQEIDQNEINEKDAEKSGVVAEKSQEAIEDDDEIEQDDEEVEQNHEEMEQDEGEDEEQNETGLEQSEDDIEENQEEIEEDEEQNETELKQAEDDIEEDEEEIETDLQQTEEDLENNQEEIEQDEEEDGEQYEAELEQTEEEHEQSAEEIEQDEEENEEQSENDQSQEERSHANMPSEQIETPEETDEIQEPPNVSHDTTGRNRKRKGNETQIKSPEIALKGTTTRNNSFQTHNRDNSQRKTKSLIKPTEHAPRMSSIRDSVGTNGSNSSDQGSGWDSHRTTRKTLRQTFGKDFTPRKSLRALVMEKSAQRHTMANVDLENIKVPQANSTEINNEVSMPSMVDNVADVAEDSASDNDISRRTRQMTLDSYLQKIKKDTLERRMKMENAVRESLKAPQRDLTSAFKLPSKLGSGLRKGAKPAAKTRKTKQSAKQVGPLPMELIKDMNYKPPKRFMPSNASWTTKRLYKFLETKLEPKYDYKARVRSEKLMETIYSFSELIKRDDVAPQVAIDQLKHEMARLNVVRTHFEFYEFFHEFMPREMRIKVIPDIQNKLSMPRDGIYAYIIRE